MIPCPPFTVINPLSTDRIPPLPPLIVVLPFISDVPVIVAPLPPEASAAFNVFSPATATIPAFPPKITESLMIPAPSKPLPPFAEIILFPFPVVIMDAVPPLPP